MEEKKHHQPNVAAYDVSVWKIAGSFFPESLMVLMWRKSEPNTYTRCAITRKWSSLVRKLFFYGAPLFTFMAFMKTMSIVHFESVMQPLGKSHAN